MFGFAALNPTYHSELAVSAGESIPCVPRWFTLRDGIITEPSRLPYSRPLLFFSFKAKVSGAPVVKNPTPQCGGSFVGISSA